MSGHSLDETHGSEKTLSPNSQRCVTITCMSTAINASAFNRGIDPVVRFLTEDQAREIVCYRGTPELQQRIEELAERCNDGDLTPDDRAEYEAYVQANKFVAILQARARKLLSKSDS